MSVDYGVLKGKVTRFGRAEDVPGGKPHFHIIIDSGDASGEWRCPVNVKSSDGSEVWFKTEQPLSDHPILEAVAGLSPGLKELRDRHAGFTLDFIREPLFDRGLMTHLPFKATGAQNDVQDFLQVLTQRAKDESGSDAYIFGSFWRNKQFDPDKFFGTKQGVHDVHMNQGNNKSFAGDDGVFQDGGVIFHYPSTGWVGFFIAFGTQVWFTDNVKGHRLPGFAEGPLANLTTTPVDPGTPPDPSPDMSIVAALINPDGSDPGKETVTLFNAGALDVDLADWRIVDRQEHTDVLQHRMLHSNEAATIKLTGHGAQLGNNGGSIRLLNPQGVVVNSVTYSKAQASQSGKIIRF